jgi:Tol biopolymer transport system component
VSGSSVRPWMSGFGKLPRPAPSVAVDCADACNPVFPTPHLPHARGRHDLRVSGEIPARLVAALADRYRIEGEVGEGGMATVYLAEDLKHDRKVALKVLRLELAAVLGAERFIAEIKTTAALQHPHILPLYDSGEADGFLFYVMPFIDGETLRGKLDRESQLSVAEALRIATDVAYALQHAHEQGIIHRDIKPENILLAKGRPMVADFGIALAVSAAGGGRMTETGLSLGTPYYMSPEQATAEKTITGRSDVYSLATVLYEMLSGEPPHGGGSAQQIIMKIIADTPRPLTELRKSVPRNVAEAVGKALQKLPADRFDSAEEFAAALANPAFTVAGVTGEAGPAAAGVFRSRGVALAAGAGVLAVGLALGALLTRPEPAAERVVRFVVDLPPGVTLDQLGPITPFTLSPDGRYIAFAARTRDDPTTRLFVRRTDRLDAVPLLGTEGATKPFFSPDGRTIGFVANMIRGIRTVAVDGGPVGTISSEEMARGVAPSWGDDGSIVFVGGDYSLHRVSEGGGPSTLVPGSVVRGGAGALDSVVVFPALLPGGRVLLGTKCPEGIVRGSFNCSGALGALDIATGAWTALGLRGNQTWYADGYLVFSQEEGTLYAVAFDADRLTLDGEPVRLLDGLGARPMVSLTPTGTLAYVPVGEEALDRVIVEVDRQGRETTLVQTPGAYRFVRLSPDGTRIVMVDNDANGNQVYVYDRRSGTSSPLTFEGSSQRPSWSPDGRTVAYSHGRPDPERYDVWTVPADGSAAGAPVAEGKDVVQHTATSWTPDGQWIIIDGLPDGGEGVGADDIFALPASGEGPLRPVVATQASEQSGEVSPDGRWIAYTSDDAGFSQVYLQPFLRPGGRTLVSERGGDEPAWVSDHELAYVSADDSLMLATLDLGAAVRVTRTGLFDYSPYFRGNLSWREYDVSPDGQSFILTRSTSRSEGSSPVVVLNWLEEVRGVMEAGRR